MGLIHSVVPGKGRTIMSLSAANNDSIPSEALLRNPGRRWMYRFPVAEPSALWPIKTSASASVTPTSAN